MISSIHIEGFRCFKHFDMTDLGQVNLLVGTNNSGKTSILEAIYLLTSRGDPYALWQMLWRRGERTPGERSREDGLEFDVTHLFNGHELRLESSFTLSAKNQSPERFIKCEVVTIADKERSPETGLSKIGLKVSGNPRPLARVIPLTQNGGISADMLNSPRSGIRTRGAVVDSSDEPRTQYITTESLDGDDLTSLWNQVVLTKDEDLVLRALQCLEPEIERIAAHSLGPRYFNSLRRAGFIVKHRQFAHPIPIGSMGDGMWRMLAMSIAIARCKGGVLIIDEIDTGLHHSAMGNMWRLLISAAEKFQVQVFATTHSSDCIYSLVSAAAGRDEYLSNFHTPANVTLQRIERDQSRAVAYTEDEIRIASKHEVEMR